MSIKSILAPITGNETHEGALVAGLQLARGLGAFVDVLHVRADPRTAIPLMTEGVSGAVVDRIIEMAEREAEKCATRAEALYQAACKKAGAITVGEHAMTRFRTLTGRTAGLVSVGARVCDLVLLGRVPEAVEVDWRLTFEAALMEGGRPILLLPEAPKEGLGRSIAVAWNGSMEAAHAASAALPLLARAEHVLLLAGESEQPIEPTLDAVAEWLLRHGIKVTPKRVKLEAWPVGEELVTEAAKAGADLLVMGGYGHSRMRETIFGGATRAVLNDAALPVLMAH